MSEIDSSRDKLIASMRNTKTGAAKKRTAKRTDGLGTSNSIIDKRTENKIQKTRGEKSSNLNTVTNDPYQSNGRVWPD